MVVQNSSWYHGESIELNKSGYKFVKSWLEFFIRYLLPRFSFLTYYFEPTILEIQELWNRMVNCIDWLNHPTNEFHWMFDSNIELKRWPRRKKTWKWQKMFGPSTYFLVQKKMNYCTNQGISWKCCNNVSYKSPFWSVHFCYVCWYVDSRNYCNHYVKKVHCGICCRKKKY